MPLSRRRAFGGKLYERETGGTADVYFAAEELRGERVEVGAASLLAASLLASSLLASSLLATELSSHLRS
jgi:hypothetical protein